MPQFGNIKAGLFDHDGTLAHSETIALTEACFLANEIFKDRSLDINLSPQQFMKYAGKIFPEILLAIAKEHLNGQAHLVNFSTKDLSEFSLIEEERAQKALRERVEPTDDSNEVLELMRSSGLILGVVTSSRIERIHACFERTGQDAFFEERVFSAQSSLPTPMPKPAPDIYIHAMERLNVLPSDCFAIEDSSSGILSSVRANVETRLGYVGGDHIKVGERTARAGALFECGAQYVVENMVLVPSILEDLAKGAGVSIERHFGRCAWMCK